jgi:hypothetical protein
LSDSSSPVITPSLSLETTAVTALFNTDKCPPVLSLGHAYK